MRRQRRTRAVGMVGSLVVFALAQHQAFGQQLPVLGETFAHDPSPIIKDGSTYYYYATGQDILARSSTDLQHWVDAPSVFSSLPAWTTADVPGFTGDFWAPHVQYFNNLYHLYYAVSTFGSQVSGIGMATSPTLNPTSANYLWTDHGPVIESRAGANYNTIDPSVITNSDGTLWMTFGSYWKGIYLQQLNPSTGLLLNPAATPIHLAQKAGSDTSLEASYLYQHNGYYYLFTNWGMCCQGIASTYNVRIGRSTSITGPFLDQSGVNLLGGGGTSFLSANGNYIGPGQVGITTVNGQDLISYHYYNGANNGTPALALQDLYWSNDNWPTTTQSLLWNANTTGTVHDGGGTWDLTHTNFLSGTTNQTWNSSGYGGATFGSAAGPAGVVTLAQNTTVQGLTFNAASSGSYTLAGGGFTLNLAGGANIVVNADATISAPITCTGFTKLGTATLTLTNTVTATGFFPRAGTTVLAGNAAVSTATSPVSTANQYSSIGLSANDNATVTVMNNASLTVAGDLNVGDFTSAGLPVNGVLNVRDSATVSARTLYVGKFAGATGTINQTGGTVTEADNGAAPGEWRLGGGASAADSASVGVYNLSGGTLVTGAANLQVGAYGHGTLTVTGGTVTAGANGAGYLSIGRFAGSVGLLDLSSGNGTFNATAAAPFLIVGEQGTGTLKVGANAALSAKGLAVGYNNGGVGTVTQTGGLITLGVNGLVFGNATSATGAVSVGTYTLAGGTLVTPVISRNNQSTVTGVFNFNGGTLQPATTNAVLIPSGLTKLNVQAGGAVVDTAGLNASFAQALVHDAGLGATADGGLTKNGSGTLTLSALDSYTGPTTVNGGTLNLGVNPSSAIQVRTTPVKVAGGASLVLGVNTHVSRVALVAPTLTIAGSAGNWTGQVDLNDNDMVVKNGNLATLTDQIGQGFNAGGTTLSTWSGAGITSSTAVTNRINALGVLLNDNGSGSPLYGSGTPLGTFDTLSPAASDVLVKYTYFGDANLDGQVDGSDYSKIDNGFARHLTGWANGDFNYDGAVDGSDYTLIDNAFNTQGATLAATINSQLAFSTARIATATAQVAGAQTAVPEPASVLLPSGLAILLARRKKQ